MTINDKKQRVLEVMRERLATNPSNLSDILSLEFKSALYFPDAVEVIRHQDALLKEAEEALEFYANPNEYCRERKGDSGQNWIECDDGIDSVAIAALTKLQNRGE